MASISAASFDATVRHQVFLERLKAGHAQDITPYLKAIDRYIRRRLSKSELTDYRRRRLMVLIDAIDKMIAAELTKFSKQLTLDLGSLAVAESIFEAKSLTNAVANPAFESIVPAPGQVRATVIAAPLSVRGAQGGKLLKPFLKDWSKTQRDSLVGIIRQGVFEGQTNAQIIKAVRGTAPAKFRDGKLAVVNRQTEALVRTAVQHVSSVSRQIVYEANSDLVKAYQWTSVLDSRTTAICQGLDGRTYKIGEGPVPPAHINCRSTTVPVLDERFKFLKEGATQSSATGPVPADQNYFDWLKNQPAAFQDNVLGPTRGRLLRNGGLTADRFAQLRLDKNFKPLTLAEMQRLEPLAFEHAGIKLNPATGLPISGR
jgi:SPP1 gp7 family putative phage head morphogenesis protein